jgi:hypothetical protein
VPIYLFGGEYPDNEIEWIQSFTHALPSLERVTLSHTNSQLLPRIPRTRHGTYYGVSLVLHRFHGSKKIWDVEYGQEWADVWREYFDPRPLMNAGNEGLSLTSDFPPVVSHIFAPWVKDLEKGKDRVFVIPGTHPKPVPSVAMPP